MIENPFGRKHIPPSRCFNKILYESARIFFIDALARTSPSKSEIEHTCASVHTALWKGTNEMDFLYYMKQSKPEKYFHHCHASMTIIKKKIKNPNKECALWTRSRPKWWG